MGYYKIGFHTGPGGNQNGIGDHWRALDAAGVPATLVSVDDYEPELVALAAASGVPHNILFRFNKKIPDFNPDVPAYHVQPEVAGGYSWQTVRNHLPPELVAGDARQYVWLILGNEVDKQHANWLGLWAHEVAQLANADGWRVAAFGWSPGEPEYEHWLEPGMRAYLLYCSQHPEMAAVAVHEYSLTLNLQDNFPYHIGRHQLLLQACAAVGISPAPRIFITEFGWTYNDLPAVEPAMQQLAWAADLYAAVPEVQGAAIWYLGGEYNKIANKAQRLIAPVTQAALAYEPPPEPPQPPPPEPPQEEPARLKHTIHLLPQDTSDAELDAVTKYLAPKRTAFTYSHDVVEAVMFHSTPEGTIVAWDEGRWNMDLRQRFAWLGVQYTARKFAEIMSVPPEQPPGTGPLVDLQACMGAPAPLAVSWRGPLYEVLTEGAGQQRHQTQVDNGITYHTKDAEWEQLRFDEDYVWRGVDTSPEEGKFYRLRDSDSDSWSRWAPRSMRVGQWFQRKPLVTFYRKSDCVAVQSGVQASWLYCKAYYKSHTFFTGVQLENVVVLEWYAQKGGQLIERYYYAQGYGLVGWESHDGRRAAVSELHQPGARPDNVRERIACL